MLNRKVPPPFVKSSAFNLISPEEEWLRNGIRTCFVPGGSQDVLRIEMVFDAGKWFEHKTGAAYFTSNLLSKGTATKSSFDIAETFDQYGAHLQVNAGADFVSVSLYALSKKLSPVLDLLNEIVSAPSFPEKEFRQTQSVFLQNLKVNNEKTSYVASKLFRKSLFGPAHPYGSDVGEADVQALATEDLQRHFAGFLHCPTIFVSGKFDADNQRQMMDGFSTLPSRKDRPPVAHAIQSIPGNTHVEKPGSVQSSVRTGTRTVGRSHPDYVPVLFVSHILGGYFGSRLMKNIREEKGLTYGISASVHALRHDSYLLIGADVNKENVGVTFAEIRKELKRLRTTVISDAELETTRNHFIGSLQSEITTPFAHADKIRTIVLYGLHPDHYQNMIRIVEEITPDEIVRIAETYFHEDQFYETAVG